jgi:hypothetical protein
MKNKWAIYLTLFILSIPQHVYRFKHPEKSETQLLLDFFKAYKEFVIIPISWRYEKGNEKYFISEHNELVIATIRKFQIVAM